MNKKKKKKPDCGHILWNVLIQADQSPPPVWFALKKKGCLSVKHIQVHENLLQFNKKGCYSTWW